MNSEEEQDKQDDHAQESSQQPEGLGSSGGKTSQPKWTMKKRRKFFKKRRMIKEEEVSKTGYVLTPARAYAFNFFLFSAVGSLMPFMPIFYGLLGFSSLENGLLYAVRPLISFWCGPLIASAATNTRYRSLILFLCVAGAVASTFCISVVQSNDADVGILASSSCPDKGIETPFPIVKFQESMLTTGNLIKNLNDSLKINQNPAQSNRTYPSTWKAFLSHSGKVFYHKLKQGIVLQNLFLYVLGLTVVSEFFLSPTLHIAQALIKHSRNQSFFTNICLNRIFSKVGMIVSAITISFVAWRYKCLFRNVHYFYFHFYGFLATGCITALVALLLPRETSLKNSFFKSISNGCCYALSSWSNAGYIFGLWVAGIAEGAINAYLLWFAASNGANEMVIGMLVTIAIMTDLILHWSVGMSTKWIGYSGLLCFGIFLMSVQFFILTMINNPLYLIPAQLLSGLASSCIKSSFISCAQSNGSKEMEKVLFFVFQSAYLGLGLGLGGIFVSMPYYVFGPKKTFAALSVFTAAYTVLHILIQCISCKCGRKRPRKGKYTKVATCEANNGDWLVDALEEDELRDLKEDFIVIDENPESPVEDNCPNNNEDVTEIDMKTLEVE